MRHKVAYMISRYTRKVFLPAAIFWLVFMPVLSVNASPDGGLVVGGVGTISQSGLNTTINQTSQNMAIDWQSYNLSADERVQYIQPDVSSRFGNDT